MYRLKGSQVDFVQSTGHRILLGNSVTEGGFMMSSSCMTCHARAHVGPDGKPSVLGVFENTVDMIGYGEGSLGTSNPNWSSPASSRRRCRPASSGASSSQTTCTRRETERL